ncbi:MAG: DegT/DnrJ/EryC1/StrS family aminotransferase [Candidatus Pacebacteria bacterium]|nr:DegT/DnrJ/EryC1/StrS family aminotransferase [Candidatus Paceibacterota bacterium]
MQIPFFDYKQQLKPLKPEINKVINSVLDSGQLILGNEVRKFENNFAKFINTKYGIGVNSGTDAIKIAMVALDIKNGDEVITVANTAIPTISAIREIGAMPKFVDIKNDFTIDENKIEKVITKKTRVILSVHLYGQPCNMSVIIKIAKKHNLKILEDCAQSHGAQLKNKKVGSFGDISCFSFYPTKNLGAYGDAGIILTSNKKLFDKCKMLRTYGMKNTYYSHIEGYNSRMDEIQAGILNIKLKHLKKWNNNRRQIAEYYLNNIKNSKIILPKIKDINNHIFHLFVVRTNQRKKFTKYLLKHKIRYGIHYQFPIHLQTAYKFLNYKKGNLPITEKFSKQIVSLPIFPELTKTEIQYIVNTINNF